MPHKRDADEGRPMRLRCPECRTRRTDAHLMALHRLRCARPLCHCLRVPHPHRPGGFALCEANPMSDVRLALLHGATHEEAEDIALEIILNRPAKASRAAACPF